MLTGVLFKVGRGDGEQGYGNDGVCIDVIWIVVDVGAVDSDGVCV